MWTGAVRNQIAKRAAPGSIMVQKHVLIVDDDSLIRKGLVRLVVENDMRATEAASGIEMKKALEARKFDLVLLDVGLPGDSGFVLCGHLRDHGHIPVVLLTARGADADKLFGFGAGADDYVVKPFNPAELIARIKAILRRADALPKAERRAPVREFCGWRLDLRTRELLSPQDVHIELSSSEFDILQVFVEHPMIVLTREQLLEQAKGRSPGLYDRSVDIMVSRLRRKIEKDSASPQIIKTVRGGGYILAAPTRSLDT
jgi:two-component system OmpR family response regulator